jgi:ribosomal protein S18 acetylase RimI-like enzyme
MRFHQLLTLPAWLASQNFRLETEADRHAEFLIHLYASTRWAELAPIVNWTDLEKRAFLASQFEAQRRHYAVSYPATDRAILEKDGAPVGRLYVDDGFDALLVVDISLLPEWRGRGIGTTLLSAVCAQASAATKTVTLTVGKFNPALSLYRRLGFREYADDGVYWRMEWRAN